MQKPCQYRFPEISIFHGRAGLRGDEAAPDWSVRCNSGWRGKVICHSANRDQSLLKRLIAQVLTTGVLKASVKSVWVTIYTTLPKKHNLPGKLYPTTQWAHSEWESCETWTLSVLCGLLPELFMMTLPEEASPLSDHHKCVDSSCLEDDENDSRHQWDINDNNLPVVS